MSEYTANVVKVYDGDTLTAQVALWPGFTVTTGVRLLGVDTPELRSRFACEKTLAKAARAAAIAWIAGRPVTLRNVQHGKYAGRVLAEVWINGQRLAHHMIDTGHGRIYHGGKREGWCR
jgi:micrococcal nuclease